MTWIDAAVEYTILKHEVRLIRLQYANVLKAMQSVSAKWPKKKRFIQGAYKLLLFSKSVHPLAREVHGLLSKGKEEEGGEGGVQEYFDFNRAKAKALLALDGEEEEEKEE